MLKFGKQFPERTWAIEGCNGIGKHIADRLLADGEDRRIINRRERPFIDIEGSQKSAFLARTRATRSRSALGQARVRSRCWSRSWAASSTSL
jgi:hypothetical protein